MNELVEIWERPFPGRCLIAGWHQWADAGAVSSGLPQYLVEWTDATKIGRIAPDGFYLFQIPGTHDLLRPVVRLNEGYIGPVLAHLSGHSWQREFSKLSTNYLVPHTLS